MTATITHETLTLSRPMIHTGDLRNVTIRLADDFVPFPADGASPLRWCVFMDDPQGATVDGVRIEGSPTWQARWNDVSDLSPGICAALGGLLITRAVGCTVQNVYVEGLPGVAVQVNGATDCDVREVVTDRTKMGVRIGPDQPSRNVRVFGVLVGDTWVPGDGDPMNAPLRSLRYPGAHTGGSAFVATNTTQLVVSSVSKEPRGRRGQVEGKGMKLNSVQWARVTECSLPNLQVQGVWEGDPPGSASLGILIDRCVIDRTSSYRVAEPSNKNGIHIHGGARDVWVMESSITSDGGGGHGVWIDASEVKVAGCTISGWNGSRGGRPGHAIAAVNGGVIQNRDTVEQDNEFTNQERVLLLADEA